MRAVERRAARQSRDEKYFVCEGKERKEAMTAEQSRQALAAAKQSRETLARVVQFTPLGAKEYIIARDATIAYEPSVFGGDGSETRVNLVLRVADHVRGVLSSIETNAALDRPLCSVIRDDGTIRIKLDTEAVRIWGADHLPTSAPDRWRDRVVHACIEVRGFWTSRTSAGLSAVCTDLQLVADQGNETPSCPFLGRPNSLPVC